MVNVLARTWCPPARRILAASGLLWGVLTSSCAGVRLLAPTIPAEPPGLYFEHVRYDGHWLSGLLLLEARAPFVLDRHLSEYVDVVISDARDCSTNQLLSPIAADFGWPLAKDQDFVPLEAGEWFGRGLHFLLFTDPYEPPVGPACIDFELAFVIPGAQGPVATFRGRANQVSAEQTPPAEGAKDEKDDAKSPEGVKDGEDNAQPADVKPGLSPSAPAPDRGGTDTHSK